MTACPICGANASFSPTASRNSDVDCPRCGPYHITHEALSALQGNFIRKVPIRWAITSHALRRTGSTPERRSVTWTLARRPSCCRRRCASAQDGGSFAS